MIFEKKQQDTGAYFSFSFNPSGDCWHICLPKDNSKDTLYAPKSIYRSLVKVVFTPETDTNTAYLTLEYGNSVITMESYRFGHETMLLGMDLKGYDQNGNIVIEYEGNTLRIDIPGLLFNAKKSFHCSFSEEKIELFENQQSVMTLRPVIRVFSGCYMEIDGQIKKEYQQYFPYLVAILAYRRLYFS